MRDLLFLEDSFKVLQDRLQRKLTIVDTINSILGLSGMVLAIIENEIYLNQILYFDEKLDNKGVMISYTVRLKDIDENPFCTFLRVVVSVTSFLAVILIVVRYRLKLLYEKSISKLDPHETIFSSGMYKYILIEGLYLLLHLPPRVNTNFSTTERGSFLSYSADIIITTLMKGRIYLIARLFGCFSKWSNSKSRKVLQENRMLPLGTIFALKAELKMRPYLITPLSIIISILLFGLSLRSAEVTFIHASKMDWLDYSSGYWCILITMTTVGYGDFAAATDLGRFISVLAGLWGVFLFSLMVVSFSNSSTFTKFEARAFEMRKESKTFNKIVIQAASVIVAAIRLYIQKKKDLLHAKGNKTKNLSHSTLKLHSIFEHKIVSFKKFKKEISAKDFTKTFESLIKMTEAKIYSDLDHLKSSRKSYTNTVISLHLTEILHTKLGEKVEELHKLYSNILEKLYSFQNVTEESQKEQQKEWPITTNYLHLIQLKKKVAQEYIGSLISTATSIVAKYRRNSSLNTESLLQEVGKRESTISEKLKELERKYSYQNMLAPITEANNDMTNFGQESPDSGNESSDDENKTVNDSISRVGSSRTQNLSRFSRYKSTKNNLDEMDEGQVINGNATFDEQVNHQPVQKGFRNSTSEQIKPETNIHGKDNSLKARAGPELNRFNYENHLDKKISDPIRKNYQEDSKNKLDELIKQNEESKNLNDDLTGIRKSNLNVSSEEFENQNQQFDLPIKSLIANWNSEGKNETSKMDLNIIPEDNRIKKKHNSLDHRSDGDSSYFLNKSNEKDNIKYVYSMGPPAISQSSTNSIDNTGHSFRNIADYQNQETARIVIKEDPKQVQYSMLKKESQKLRLNLQDDSSIKQKPSKALLDFLSTDFASLTRSTQQVSVKESALWNDNSISQSGFDSNPQISSERALLQNQSYLDSPLYNLNLKRQKIDSFNISVTPTNKSEKRDSSFSLSQNETTVSPIGDDYNPFQIENPNISQLLKHVIPTENDSYEFTKLGGEINILQSHLLYSGGKGTPEIQKRLNQGSNTRGNRINAALLQDKKSISFRTQQMKQHNRQEKAQVKTTLSNPKTSSTQFLKTNQSKLSSKLPNQIVFQNNPLDSQISAFDEDKNSKNVKFDPKKWAAAQLLNDGKTKVQSNIQPEDLYRHKADNKWMAPNHNQIKEQRVDFRILLGLK